MDGHSVQAANSVDWLMAIYTRWTSAFADMRGDKSVVQPCHLWLFIVDNGVGLCQQNKAAEAGGKSDICYSILFKV